MCIYCDIAEGVIDLSARDYITTTLNGETLSTGQLETLLEVDPETFGAVMISITERGREASALGLL